MRSFSHHLPSIVCTIAVLSSAFAQGIPESVRPRDTTHETLAYYLLLIHAPGKLAETTKSQERFQVLEKQHVVPAGGWKAGERVSKFDVVTTLYGLLHPKGSGGIKTVVERRAALEEQGVNVSHLPEALAKTASLLGRAEETGSILDHITLGHAALLTEQTISGAFTVKDGTEGMKLEKDGTLVYWEGEKSVAGTWKLHPADRLLAITFPEQGDSPTKLVIMNKNIIGFFYDRYTNIFFREGTPTQLSSVETLKAMNTYFPSSRAAGKVDRTHPQAVAEAFWKAVLAHQWEKAAAFVHKDDREWFLKGAPKQIPELPNPPKHPVIKVEFKDDDLGTTRITNWKEWEVGLDMIMRGGTWWISN